MTTVATTKEQGLAWTRDALLREATAIADELLERRLSTPDGGMTWVGPVGYGTELHPLERRQLPPHLYNGTTGIALFFAALAQVGGEDRHRESALRTIAPLRRKLDQLVADPERAGRLRIRLGGLLGLGSFIYGLLRIGELLERPELVREAHRATVLITPDRIARDHQVRVQTGSAGALLALLALHHRMPEANERGETPLDLADRCADHLIAERIAFDGRPRAWALSPGKPPLAGFSYGAAGISYALLRLHRLRPRPEVERAAREGLAFVRGLYSPEDRGWRDVRALFETRYRPRRGNWKDWWASGTLDDLEPRDPDAPVADDVAPAPERACFLDIWCHGAAGIALGRLAALDVEDSPAIHDEIRGVVEQAPEWLRLAADHELHSADDLCCGHMGRVELLLETARRLGDERARRDAHALLHAVWRRARRSGRYELSAARGTDVYSPYLFQGVAGIGYTMLRLAAPEALPCLLVLE